MLRRAKRLVHRTLGAYGYAIVRPSYGVHDDAFDAQAHLLGERGIRVVFDVGANLGQTSTIYADRFPSAEIHAFEPFTDSFRAVERIAGDRPQIHAWNLAVAETSGHQLLHVNERSSTNSLFATSTAAGSYVDARLMQTRQTLEVASTSLDDFAQAHGIERVDVLKMDIQGGELLALRGAARLLESRAIRLVYSEVLFAPLYEGQATFCDLHRHLASLDYGLYGLFDQNYGQNGLLAWADAIWVSPEIAGAL